MLSIKLARVAPRVANALYWTRLVLEKIFGAVMFLICLASFGLIALILLGVVG